MQARLAVLCKDGREARELCEEIGFQDDYGEWYVGSMYLKGRSLIVNINTPRQYVDFEDFRFDLMLACGIAIKLPILVLDVFNMETT